MALKAAIFVLVSLLLVASTREVATPVGGGAVAPSPAPVPAPAPAPAPHIFVNFEECPLACKARCKLHSRQGLCNRACMTCCKGCKCVPPGTAGNRELCGPCYTLWTTHGNRTKCP
ncbi:snakin-2 [Dendrobium catenatum]|nr:snakin-2 [Dendrobium catenatum]